jgi:di/tricarboxylate transporter
MFARAIAIALLVAGVFGVTTPLLAAAMRTTPRCCHTTACPMMKQQSSGTRWATCDPDQSSVLRGTHAPAILTAAIGFTHATGLAQSLATTVIAMTSVSSFAIEHPPRRHFV